MRQNGLVTAKYTECVYSKLVNEVSQVNAILMTSVLTLMIILLFNNLVSVDIKREPVKIQLL